MHEDQQRLSHEPPPQFSRSAINDRSILERITVLLSHFWTADEDEALRKGQLRDWLDDLGHFPASVVAVACQDWRQTQTRRPMIADILRLCGEIKPLNRPPDRLRLGGSRPNASRPAPHVIRDEFYDGLERYVAGDVSAIPYHIRDWSSAELDLVMHRRDDQAEALGFGRGRDARTKLAAHNLALKAEHDKAMFRRKP